MSEQYANNLFNQVIASMGSFLRTNPTGIAMIHVTPGIILARHVSVV